MNDPKAALRDLLDGRVRGYDRRLRHFSERDWRRYGDLLSGALLLAVRRRFRAGQDRAPVIRFVATVRERYDHTGHDLDPVVAERLVWAALGEGEPVPVVGPAVAAQTLLVLGLLEDEGMPRADLDDFLAAADTLTHPTTTEPSPTPPPIDPMDPTAPAGPASLRPGAPHSTGSAR
ncbi:hypothetical protein [Micromonospora zhanjiangensis]|uniref:Uncharacterized protein n=1 Tax=Micromonospora zhanjiangensis TaxID=1522057 RepID=A0ABV8KQH7_9ACTN